MNRAPLVYLQHTRENRRITCAGLSDAERTLHRQWRDPDGSIPWTIKQEVATC